MDNENTVPEAAIDPLLNSEYPTEAEMAEADIMTVERLIKVLKTEELHAEVILQKNEKIGLAGLLIMETDGSKTIKSFLPINEELSKG